MSGLSLELLRALVERSLEERAALRRDVGEMRRPMLAIPPHHG